MPDEQTKAYEKRKQKAIPWQKENPDTKFKPMGNKYQKKPATTPTSILRQNASKNFVQRVLRAKEYPVMKNKDGSVSTHLMAAEIDEKTGKNIVFPTMIQDKKSEALKQMELRAAQQYAIDSGEYIDFPTLDEAVKFSQSYKEGTNADLQQKKKIKEGLY